MLLVADGGSDSVVVGAGSGSDVVVVIAYAC